MNFILRYLKCTRLIQVALTKSINLRKTCKIWFKQLSGLEVVAVSVYCGYVGTPSFYKVNLPNGKCYCNFGTEPQLIWLEQLEQL